MTKVTVDISDKVLNAETQKELKRLERQVERLKASNIKLKVQVQSQKDTVQRARDVVGTAMMISDTYREEFGDEG